MPRRATDLTPIQREILQHRAEGKSYKEIREIYPRLGPYAIKGQIANAMAKLGAFNGEQAIAIAMRRGLIA